MEHQTGPPKPEEDRSELSTAPDLQIAWWPGWWPSIPSGENHLRCLPLPPTSLGWNSWNHQPVNAHPLRADSRYFQDDFISSKGAKCQSMIRGGFFIDAESYGEALWKKLKDRTDGALLDWTRQHAPPWDFMYLNCMKTLSCRPLDDAEVLPVLFPRPQQSKLPYVRVPKDAKFEVCAGEWESCDCVGYVYFGTKTRRSPVVRVPASEGKIECKADNFEGDPAVGDVKKCQCAKE